ncbi:Gfo/Idh/MocA family oxidoreductase [Streptomyces sp. NBC_01220]|uniref:Gfo/Idh/MocA family protein n=1 Tax=Streptomyces sp. NBC_01220 TaxID=2903781 RepID=UPI00352EF1EE|nr:Gfo/Idh/MocA family oxidoreductase [Streptomyces sp. NBC_01220]
MRILIASGVRHARDYVPLLRSLPGIEVIGCADTEDSPFRDDSAALAAATGIPFLDLEQGLASCDIALVCSEPTRHADFAVTALEAGRHVIVDKPAATTTRDAQRLWEAADRSRGLLTAVHRLHSPQIARARRTVDSGAIGLPLAVDAEWLAAGGLDGATVERPELVCDPALSGGGELMNFGWYPALAIRYLTGLEVEEVVAFSSAAPHVPLFDGPHGAYGVEDAAVLSLRLGNGVVATVTVSRTPAGVGPAPVSSSLRVLGSHGHVLADEDAPAVTVRTAGGDSSAHQVAGPAATTALRLLFTEFCDDIRYGRTPLVTAADIHAAVAVAEAALSSSREGGAPVAPAVRTAGDSDALGRRRSAPVCGGSSSR